MILATVITCPQRWREYQRMRRNYVALGFPFPLRTFQTKDGLGNAYVNNNLNSRAALAYANHHLPDTPDSWVLYLEDDIVIEPQLPALLPGLVQMGVAENVDCWFLCNRKNEVVEQVRNDGLVINKLAFPPIGGQGLMLPKRHLPRILAAHWSTPSDNAIFRAINHPSLKIWQIIRPVLVEHVGVVSTYMPEAIQKIEVNYAD